MPWQLMPLLAVRPQWPQSTGSSLLAALLAETGGTDREALGRGDSAGVDGDIGGDDIGGGGELAGRDVDAGVEGVVVARGGVALAASLGLPLGCRPAALESP